MHLVTDDIDHRLLELLFKVYVDNPREKFQIHEGEFTIYIQLYTYFLDRYTEQHNTPDPHEDFMRHFLKEGLPAYQDFLEEVIALLDRFHLTYEYVDLSGERAVNLTKGGFGCAL